MPHERKSTAYMVQTSYDAIDLQSNFIVYIKRISGHFCCNDQEVSWKLRRVAFIHSEVCRIRWSTMLDLVEVLQSPVSLAVVSVTTTLMVFVGYTVLGRKQKSDHGVPKLVHKDNKLNRHILKKCSCLHEPFVPVFWARNSHVQTIIRTFLPGDGAVFKREIINLSDGGILALDWLEIDDKNKQVQVNSPVLIVLPGLTGSAREYGRTCQRSLQQGFRPVVFNKRGHGGCALATPKMQSFGDPIDFREVVELLHKRYPSSNLVALGASAGSGLLASYAGEYTKDPILAAGIGVSPGYDGKKLFSKNSILPFYERIMVGSLKQLVKPHVNILSKAVDMDEVLKAKSVAEFEEKFYSRLHGYNNMEDYWAANNPVRAVECINIPFLCISSLDDTVCRKYLIPMDAFAQHDTSMLVVTDYGGHVGFWEGHRLRSWSDEVAMQYLSAVLEYKDKEKWNLANTASEDGSAL